MAPGQTRSRGDARTDTGRGTGRGGLHDPAIVDIDPTSARAADTFDALRPGPKSPWTDQCRRVIELVDSGKLGLGKYVCIGRFKSAGGARVRMDKMPEIEPRLAEYRFEYQTTVDATGDGKVSELWCRIVHKSAARDTPAAQSADGAMGGGD